MVIRLGYRPVKEIRELPPRVRLVQPEPPEVVDLPPAQRYLRQLDRELEAYAELTPPPYASSSQTHPYDLVSHVFANQLADHAQQAYHLARQIVQRQELAQKHLRDIQWRLDELKDRRPIPLRGPGAGVDDGSITEVDKQILDLERQQRLTQLELWRDLADHRKDLVEARREYRSTRSRLGYLVGGDDGRG